MSSDLSVVEYKYNRNEDLIARLQSLAPQSGKFNTKIEGLMVTRINDINVKDYCFYKSSIGLILQGKKESIIGSQLFQYGAFDCMVNGVDMPSISRVIEASFDRPMLAVSLNIDKELATQLAVNIPLIRSTSIKPCLDISIEPITADVFDVFVRLVELLDKPEQIPFMGPLLKRELIARVLVGPQGDALRMIYQQGTYSNQIAEAISWLKINFRLPLKIEKLALSVKMATSTFHRQFKGVTSISPLQYQKHLRLYEAQRLMLSGNMDANSASMAVGYDSAQQFSREYKRLFGEPPLRNINRLRI